VGSRWSAPTRSCASPPVRKKPIGLPSASTRAWILVLSPPRERPIAWSSPAFFGHRRYAGGRHNGAVDHRVFVVGVCGEILKYPFPHTAFGPTAEPQVDLCPVAEPLRQIAPRHPSTVPIEHGVHEQTIVCRCYSDRAFAPRQQVPDPLPLVVAQSEPSHRSAPHMLTAHESKKSPRRNRSPISQRRLKAECGNPDSPAQHGAPVVPTNRDRLIDDRP
jgi:hypothetical protein